MAQGKYLQEDLINLGDVKRDAIIDFKIKLRQDNRHPFQYLTKSCGCTQITSTKNTILDTGEIEIKFNVANSGPPATPGKHQINRIVTVYFDDGNDDYISDDKGIRVMNPQKALERFTITGFAVVEDDNNNND